MNCTVNIASPLRSYTGNASSVTARGATVAELLSDLEQRFPGMRFRIIDEQDGIRPHIRFFAGTREIRDLSERMDGESILHIICALSGG
jgi:molybdopterin converting factor small subunit